MLKRNKYFVSLFLTGFIFSGCGSNTPDSVVKNFFDGLSSGDFKKISNSLDEKDRDFFSNDIIKLCRQNTSKAMTNMLSFNKNANDLDKLFSDIYTELLEKDIVLDFKLSNEKKEVAINKCLPAIVKSFNLNDKANIPKILSSEINGDKASVKIQNNQPEANISIIELKKVGDNWLLADFNKLFQ